MPVIALHAAVALGHRDHAQAAARRSVRSRETSRIGERARAHVVNRRTLLRNSQCADRRRERSLPLGAPARSSNPCPGLRWHRRRDSSRQLPTPSSSGSGRPANGSSLVIWASSSAARTISRCPSGDRSEVRDEPVWRPTSTRIPAPREPACFRFSNSRMRTPAENSSPSASVHSASVAPSSSARRVAADAIFQEFAHARRAPDRHAIDLHRRDADADRHALPFLPAHADAFVELQIVAHHAYVLERLRAHCRSATLRARAA